MAQCTHWQTRGTDIFRCGLAPQHEGVHEYVLSEQCEAVSGGLLKTRCGLPEGHPEGQQYHCPDPNNPNVGWWTDRDQCPALYEYPAGTINQCERTTGHASHHSHVGAVWEDPRPTYGEQTSAQREETHQRFIDFLGSTSEPGIPLLFQQPDTEQILDEILIRVGLLEQQLQARASVSAHGRTRTRLNQVARQFAELDERLTQLELHTGKSEMRVHGVDVSEWDQRWLAFEKTMAVLMERLGPPERPECGTQLNDGPCAGVRGHRGDCTANADDIPSEQECDHPNGFGVNGCPCGAPDPDASGLAVDMDAVTDAGGHWKS